MENETFIWCICEHKNHNSILKIKEHPGDVPSFDFKPVTAFYVENMLKRLKINKATAYDHMPPKMVKMCSNELSMTLMELLNYAFEYKRFPDEVKNAEIAPIFKKKDDMDKENYRPISILAVFSKVFESIIVEQLIEHFKDIFNDLLCAYRKNIWMWACTSKPIDSWKYSLDDNNFAVTLLIYLSKAFDCMPHGLLIAKMSAYGLSNDACESMSSYLCERYQRVKISNKSSWKKILKGIPQGSGLWPFLFNVFMNDIFYFMDICDLLNYADDNTLSIIRNTVNLVISALKKDAKNAMLWFTENFMQSIPTKFQFMIMKMYTSKEIIHDSIEIHGTTKKIELIQERALRFLLNDQKAHIMNY